MSTAESPVEHAAIDPIDREIIAELERDGRVSWQELGRRVRLSPNATGDRVRRLDAGASSRAIAPHRPGRVRANAGGADQRPPGSELRRRPARGSAGWWRQVEEAVQVTGRFDFELQVSSSGPDGFDDLLVCMKRELGVAETETRLVLRRIVPGPGG